MEPQARMAIFIACFLAVVPLLPFVSADDDISTAAVMTDGQSATGNVDYGGDVTDWWKIHAFTGDVVQVSVSTSMSNPAWWCPGDGYEGKVKLTDSAGTLLAGDTTISDTSSSTILSTNMATEGWVFLRINSADSWCNDGIDYTLTPTINKDLRDTDADSYVDNEDDCDDTPGSSSNDRKGCPDSDADGYSDPSPGWVAHPQGQADAFPTEGTQWFDSDDDGYGDELTGFEGDSCRNQRGFSTYDRFGCIDSDTDGWSDPDPLGLNSTDGIGWYAHPTGFGDAFMHDASQWNDTDADGYGDNWAEGMWNDSRANASNPLGQWVSNATTPDSCPEIAGTSASDRFGCPDDDLDGWSDGDENWTAQDGADAFPSNPSQWKDRDWDGWGDNQSEGATQVDDFPDNPTQWRDVDGDGYGDNQTIGATQVDNFTFDHTQWADWDGDGYGDNVTGFQGDLCPASLAEHVANNQISWADRFGCFDADSDGYSNPAVNWVSHPEGFADAFPDDPSQWHDTDADGYGDNLEYWSDEGMVQAYRGDSCTATPGSSSEDRWGCPDQDGDGWSDPMWDWLASPQGLADAWPFDPSQWHDSDGDGHGDNPLGTDADVCPETPGTSDGVEAGGDRWGCHDTDGDGWSDLGDAFIHDPTQNRDSDGDGWGDDPYGHAGDACPLVRGDSIFDRAGCRDADADGWSDPDSDWTTSQNADAFPNDRMQWRDSDGDGFGDNAVGAKRDDCPFTKGTSTTDRQGCIDGNGDGYSDEYGELNAALTIMGDNPLSSWLTYACVAIALMLGTGSVRFTRLIRGYRASVADPKTVADIESEGTEATVPVLDMNTGVVSPALSEIPPEGSAPVSDHVSAYGAYGHGDPSLGYTAAVTDTPYITEGHAGGEQNE